MKITRSWIYGVVVFVACGGASETTKLRSPNVVIVTLDTTRADRLGAYGYANAKTDTIDALASAGQRYTRAYASTPLTIPSHATLMTGLNPYSHGVRSNSSDILGDEYQTLAEVLRDEGYQTWASVAAFVTQSSWGFGQGFDRYAQDLEKSAETRHDNPWQQERPASDVIDDALEFLAEKRDEAPYFLWVHLFDAHEPLQPPTEYRGEGIDLYDAEIAYMDDQLGRLKTALGDDDVIWVIASDHGESLGEHGEYTHGLFVYNSTQHVPLIFSGADLPPAVFEQPVGLVDVMPTLLNHLGIEVPPGLDGAVQPGNPQPVYMESYELLKRFAWAPHVAVVDGDHKLIQLPQPELYDQANDWGELENLVGQSAGDVRRLQEVLEGLQAVGPEAPEAEIDAETALKLAALGYVEGASGWLSSSEIDSKGKQEVLGLLLNATSIADKLDKEASSERDAEAVSMFERVIEMEPSILETYMRLSRLHSKMGRVEKANTVLEGALERWPDSVNLMLAIAVNAGSVSDYSKVERYARRAYELDSSSVRALEILMSSFFLRGQVSAGIAFGEEYLDRHPDSSVIAGFLGIHMTGLPEYGTEEELRRIQGYLRLGLESPFPRRGIRHALALIAFAAESESEAVQLAAQELEDYPNALRTRRLLLRILAKQKRYEEQLPHWEFVRKFDSDNLDLLHSHAQTLWNAKKYSQAESLVIEGLAKKEDHPKLLMLQANVLSRKGEEAQAQEVYQRALESAKAQAAN